MKTGVFVFFLLGFAFADPDNALRQDSGGSRDQCEGYCLSVCKPFIDNFVEFKEAAVKVTSDLKSQLAIAEVQIENKNEIITQKDEQMRDKNEHIKDKNEQIRDKDEQIKSKNEQIKDQHEQIKEKNEQIRDKDEQIKDKNEQIKDKNEQIRDKDELISTKNQEIQVKSVQIKNMEDEINSLRNQTNAIFEWCPVVDREGIYKMYVRGVNVIEAPCTKDGWMIIQKRINGDVDFNRTWEAYKNGFGDIHGEFFIGLEKLYLITQAKTYELHIQLGDVNGNTSYALYDDFEIGSEKEAYYLKSIGNYSGTAGDSLDYHKGMKFTTFDRDNDMYSENCALNDIGGWWFKNCAMCKLNGKYFKDGKTNKENGITWGHWHNFDYTISLTFAQMMIKPNFV